MPVISRAAVLASTVLCLGVATLLAQQPATPPQTPPAGPTFRTTTQIVPLVVTVTDAEKRLVPDLERDNFQVFDNGAPQELTFFQNETTPFTCVVMLDTSASMTNSLDLLKQAAEQFVLRMLPADKCQVGAFNDKIQLSGTFTSDRDDLIGALNDLQFGNPTRLFDAIDTSLDQLKGIEGRRVVLVFTDGDDTYSKIGGGRVLDRAVAEETMIYAIGLQSDYFNGMRMTRSRPDRSLRKFAEETGGGYFELEKTAELAPTFTRVAQELHSQYVMGFSPKALDGKVHKLEVRVNRTGMTARARKSYIASADKLSSERRR